MKRYIHKETKVICCKDCPGNYINYDEENRWTVRAKSYGCGMVKPFKNVEGSEKPFFSIPEWCPLEDAP